MTKADWEEATAAEHITPEHVLQRLKNIADHIFENEVVAGFDSDGFLVALIAEGLRLQNGVTLIVRTNDHPPPHAHIKVRAYPEADLKVDLTTGELSGNVPKGLSAKDIRGFQDLVGKHHDQLASWWQDYHGDPVVLT
ncbi:DUF4160 domain-containing protein [Rhodococcus spongiicola]|uniref:DUF4160 domain-containing protein n=1 Tax=Rhodococcus spongiicola TaxID=2487352 RepID=A0A3S3ZJW9_9NOCA|nr:DUF4160 domain-containing protein [Rhodococcus spongiicola]RVW02432.1 DUF4160 domain-containing protein [Rhodococcus spongiicola]